LQAGEDGHLDELLFCKVNVVDCNMFNSCILEVPESLTPKRSKGRKEDNLRMERDLCATMRAASVEEWQ
jgi:hypothetical protein